MATIKEVAELAHVSVATVSRVLNGSPSVSPKSTAKVINAIHKLNYAPKSDCQKPAAQRKPFDSGLYSASEQSLLLQHSGRDQRHGQTAGLQRVHLQSGARSTAGRDFAAHNSEQAGGRHYIPFLQSGRYLAEKIYWNLSHDFCSEYVESLDAPYVGINNFQAAYDAVQHLIADGHQKIGMITNQNGFISTTQRYQGFCQALK